MTSHGQDFDAAVQALRALAPRSEVDLQEAPAPARLAPHALALTAEVWAEDPEQPDEQVEAASGRFVLLHDPVGQDAWQGRFRVVSFMRGLVERDLASDPLLNDVAWDWLVEALAEAGAEHVALSGTVTRTLSSSFGEIDDRHPRGEIELRCSWTPTGPAASCDRHARAWITVLTTMAGLPPLPEGVASLPRR